VLIDLTQKVIDLTQKVKETKLYTHSIRDICSGKTTPGTCKWHLTKILKIKSRSGVRPDANNYLWNGLVKRLMAQQGLQEVLLSKHKTKPMVATFNQNTDHKLIHSIFATQGIKIRQTCTMPLTERSNHHIEPSELTLALKVGTKLTPTAKAKAKGLQTKDPREWSYGIQKHWNTSCGA
jgi:hypothetical protein